MIEYVVTPVIVLICALLDGCSILCLQLDPDPETRDWSLLPLAPWEDNVIDFWREKARTLEEELTVKDIQIEVQQRVINHLNEQVRVLRHQVRMLEDDPLTPIDAL